MLKLLMLKNNCNQMKLGKEFEKLHYSVAKRIAESLQSEVKNLLMKAKYTITCTVILMLSCSWLICNPDYYWYANTCT